MANRVAMWIVTLFLTTTVVQIYAAGVFAFGAGGPTFHALLGWALIALALLTLIACAVLRVGRIVALAAILLCLTVLQPVLAFAPRARAPYISALHPVIGVAILFVALAIRRRVRSVVVERAVRHGQAHPI